MIAAISARVISPFGSMMVAGFAVKQAVIHGGADRFGVPCGLRSKSRKSVALRVVVFAADALTASDKHDTAARNNARIRFCLHVEVPPLECKGNAWAFPLNALRLDRIPSDDEQNDAMAVLVTASRDRGNDGIIGDADAFAEVSPTPLM